MKEESRGVFERKRSTGIHNSVVSVGRGSPDHRDSAKPRRLFAESVKDGPAQLRRTLKPSQKVLNKENFSSKKGLRDSLGAPAGPKSQSLVSKKNGPEESPQFNIYKTRSPDNLVDKTGKPCGLLAEKFDSLNSGTKPRNNRSLNEPKNFVIGSMAKKKSDGLISSNLFMQKYQSFIKNGTSNTTSTSKLNPYFLFKSRAK